MRKTMSVAITVAMLSLLGVAQADVITKYDVNSYLNATSTASATPADSSANVTAGNMTSTGANAKFSAAQNGNIYWVTSTTGTNLATSIAANQLFQFTVGAQAGYELNLTNLTFNFGANQTSVTKTNLPAYVYLQISTDGGATFETVGSPTYRFFTIAETTNLTPATVNLATMTVDLSAYTGLTNDVTFRIGSYLSQYGNAARYIRGGDVTLNGTVSAIPEPATIGMVGVGAMCALLLRRRIGKV